MVADGFGETMGFDGDKVRFFLSPELKVSDVVLSKIKSVLDCDKIEHPVVCLPDLHYKYGRPIPTGMVIASKKHVIPAFTFASCGMSCFITDLTESGIDDGKLDGFFGFLKSEISADKRAVPLISETDYYDIINKGVGWMTERYGFKKDSVFNIENNGSCFSRIGFTKAEIDRVVPDYVKEIGLRSIGVLGIGNHFIELQEVEKILDSKTAGLFGLRKGQIVIMLHSSSEAFGKALYDYYSVKVQGGSASFKQRYRNFYHKIYPFASKNRVSKGIVDFVNKQGNFLYRYLNWKGAGAGGVSFSSVSADSELGRDYVLASRFDLNFSYANRMFLMKTIEEGLSRFFGGGRKLKLLWDGNHDSLQLENGLWVHRNGASTAYGSSSFDTHNIFSKTGQPVLVPGSMGSHSYVCAAGRGNGETYYSANHGAGRMLDRPEARAKFKIDDLKRQVESFGVRLYRYGFGDIVEECPEAYKDVNKIIEAMTMFKIAQPVARLKPIAVLKGG